jgi:hypothetical protein
VVEAAIRESAEEWGMQIDEVQLIRRDINGATVERDLYYVTGRIIAQWQQDLEEWEVIDGAWYSKDDVLNLLKQRQVQEWRTRAFLWDYISQ